MNLKPGTMIKDKTALGDEYPIGIVFKIDNNKVWAWWGNTEYEAKNKMKSNPTGKVFFSDGRKLANAVEWVDKKVVRLY